MNPQILLKSLIYIQKHITRDDCGAIKIQSFAKNFLHSKQRYAIFSIWIWKLNIKAESLPGKT